MNWADNDYNAEEEFIGLLILYTIAFGSGAVCMVAGLIVIFS